MVFRTQVVEAIILSQRDFGEADRLLIVYAKQLGKITILGKGVRRIKSRRGGNLDVLNYVTISLAYGQTFWLVTEASVISSFQEMKENLSKSLYGYYLAELINTLTPEEEPSLTVFYLLRDTLSLFSKHPRRILILAFEIKLLHALGFFNADELHTKNVELVALAAQFQVQSLQKLLSLELEQQIMSELSGVVRKELLEVAEHEFRSPKILAQLRTQIESESE